MVPAAAVIAAPFACSRSAPGQRMDVRNSARATSATPSSITRAVYLISTFATGANVGFTLRRVHFSVASALTVVTFMAWAVLLAIFGQRSVVSAKSAAPLSGLILSLISTA